jgi:hypothetical protein
MYEHSLIYIYMYAHPTPMSNSERLSQFDLKIYKVCHQEHLAVDEDDVSH